jgi:hypothetical protein
VLRRRIEATDRRIGVIGQYMQLLVQAEVESRKR